MPRAGIVHRLDKDTSGLMVVAKTLPAQTELVRQLQARTVKRVYRAIADGVVPFDGTIDANIGRDANNRLKMAVLKFGGKPAITHIRVLERFASHSHVECKLETGRTHQIRVHMREAGHPLAGDPVYGNPRHKMDEEIAAGVKALGRQALHAFALAWSTRPPARSAAGRRRCRTTSACCWTCCAATARSPTTRPSPTATARTTKTGTTTTMATSR
ncbi:Ribosomal large subunit pseudouridine synthase D [Chromobacterium violaceum]|uniref:Ribosomal large subunit pseudouridine synthase D n=1 Tax=Chromobacterium violaceum TaxID=536 RepID=A0A3S4IFZ8_CHRVL|nr:Ribosomal large subunit pseudouridine synthase D [Chromobacterium violaceum]